MCSTTRQNRGIYWDIRRVTPSVGSLAGFQADGKSVDDVLKGVIP